MNPVAILGSSELPEGGMKTVLVGEQEVLLVRGQGQVYALQAYCPHHGAPLVEGVLSGTRLVCPWHHACFDVRDGKLLEPPALDALTCFGVRQQGQTIWVEPAPRVPPPPSRPLGSARRTLVILGGGAAGQSAVEELRRQGFGGRLVLISAEPELPYDRPHLSKDYLVHGLAATEAHAHSQGGKPEQQEPPAQEEGSHMHSHPALALRGEGFYRAMDIELRLGRPITRLDVQTRRVELAGGEVLSYDAALLATGGLARRLEIPGADLEGVFSLRSLGDARRLVTSAKEAKQVILVGAGFIGMEVAASLRKGGLEVTIVAPDPIPLKRVLGERVGRTLQALHEAQGVRFRLGSKLAAIEGSGRVRWVRLEDGEILPADLVLVGIGVRPATAFVQGLELAEDGSVPVDASLQAARGLWAAGDIARFPDPQSGRPVRVEHWRLSQQHGRVAARAMLGLEARYQGVPFFWSEQYDHSLVYVGHAAGWNQEAYWGEPETGDFLAFYGQEGRLLAACGLWRDREMAALEELLRTRRAPPFSAFEAESFDLVSLLI